MRFVKAANLATVVTTLALAHCLAPAFGDSWALPTAEIYLSPNGSVAVRIVPREVSSQLDYFADLSAGQASPGLPSGATTTVPRAEIYRNSGFGSFTLATSFDLVNTVAPASALISDDGQYLVTFDNWHSLGDGDHVVAIYRTDGSLVRSMSLSDLLTEQDIRGLSRSVSSTHWSGRHYIDSESALLVLLVASCALGEPDCEDRFARLEIDLPTGRPRSEKRDLLPHWVGRVTLQPDESPVARDPDRSANTALCDSGWTEESFEQAHHVPFGDLLATDESTVLPAYTESALRAKIRGRLRFELLASPGGSVVCVRSLKTLPMGLTEAASATLLDWNFKRAGSNTPLRKSRVTVIYDLVLVPPPQ